MGGYTFANPTLGGIAANYLIDWAQLSARLIELDGLPVNERARLDYTDGGQSYSWSGFRSSLESRLNQMEKKYEDLAMLDAKLSWGGETVFSVIR